MIFQFGNHCLPIIVLCRHRVQFCVRNYEVGYLLQIHLGQIVSEKTSANSYCGSSVLEYCF